ncbi:hypothetical protein X777_15936, partial [Ooceraea biroi]
FDPRGVYDLPVKVHLVWRGRFYCLMPGRAGHGVPDVAREMHAESGPAGRSLRHLGGGRAASRWSETDRRQGTVRALSALDRENAPQSMPTRYQSMLLRERESRRLMISKQSQSTFRTFTS